MEAVTDTLTRQNIPAPRCAEDLLPLMQLYRISVGPRAFDLADPLISLDFHAAFEEEHGIGVLTDGQEALGIGYACDVQPFGWKPMNPRLGPIVQPATRSVPDRDGASLWRRLFGGR